MQLRHVGLPALLLAPALSSCNSGLAALVGSVGGDDATNAAPSVAELGVTQGRVSPALVGFTLTDNEGDPVGVRLTYRLPGEDPVEIALAAGEAGLSSLAASGSGVQHQRRWDFASQLGAEFRDEVELEVVLLPGAGASQTRLVELGNDAPELTQLSVPAGEVVGVAVIDMLVADSSADVVQVDVEYDVIGDEPDLGFLPATAAGTGSAEVVGSPTGTPFTFFWDVQADLGFAETAVSLRLTPRDVDFDGLTAAAQLNIDNNSAPIAILETANFISNPDRHDGIPIGFRVIDGDAATGEPADVVRLLFQWRAVGESFPPLPGTAAELEAILDDPALRAEFQVCTEKPRVHEGLAYHPTSHPTDANAVRLPQLLSTAFGALRVERETGAVELDGELQVLRRHRTPFALDAPAGFFENPVGAVHRPGTRNVLVLEGAGNGWRLREFDPARLEVSGLDQSGTAPGTTTALALEGHDGSVLIASDNAGTWRVQRAGPAGVTDLITADGSTELGPVRGMVALGGEAALITVGSSLIKLSYPPGEPARASALFSPDHVPLQAPWGLALDPRDQSHVFVAENGADRVLTVDLATLERRVVAAGGIGFPAPEHVALENGGSRLLVVTDATARDGLRELRALNLGDTTDLDGDGAAEQVVFEVLPGLGLDPALPAPVGGLATGPDGLRLVALPATNEVAIGGGVEQVRTITGYEHATQTVWVDQDFDPPFAAGSAARPWRLEWLARGQYRAGPDGPGGSFLWDPRDTTATEVDLRLIPIDKDVGVESTIGQARAVFPYFGGEVVTLGGPQLTDRSRIVRSGDLDGDGDLDVVSGNWQVSGGVSVFFQTGRGEFTEGELIGDPDSQLRVDDIELADLDGDGDTDIVAQTLRAFDMGDMREINVFLQTGPGVFDTGTSIATPAQQVAAADLDGDGDIDLALQNTTRPFAIELYFQESPGTFGDPLVLDEYELKGEVGGLEADDLDGDGDVDLVFTTGELVIYFQTSPGEFSLGFQLEASAGQFLSFTTDDVDLDGDVDLILALSNGITWVLQTSPGVFEEGPVVTDLGGIADFADLDEDGDLDMAVAHGGATSVSVLEQVAPGQFELRTTLNPNAGGSTDVEFADMDGDGCLDLLSANSVISTLSVFFGDHRVDFAPGPVLGDSEVTGNLIAADQGDLDGDGDLDLVTSSLTPAQVNVFYQRVPGVYEAGPVVPTLGSANDVRTADMDRDGDLDLVTMGGSDIGVLLQGSDGEFVAQPLVGILDSVFVPYYELVDVDEDGLLDVVAVIWFVIEDPEEGPQGTLGILYQTSPGDFTSPQLMPEGMEARPGNCAVVDMDADGDLDLVRANPAMGSFAIYVQTSPRQFERGPEIPTEALGHEPNLTSVADLDGNGAPDILAAGAAALGASVDLVHQARDGGFAPAQAISDFPQSFLLTIGGSLEVADVDGDGDLDFALPLLDFLNGSGLALHTQVRPGVFDLQPVLGVQLGAFPTVVLLRDFDSDGDVDAAFNSSTGGFVAVYFGNH